MEASGDQRRRSRPVLQWSGLGAVVGAVLWLAMPWLQLVTLGTRPYVATGFDVGSLAGWLLMFGGLVGFRTAFRGRYGYAGQVGVGLVGAGMVVVSGLVLRRVARLVAAGLHPVPATGEDPAGLVLSWAFLFGFGAVLVGTGLLGVALWRLDARVTASVLTLAPLLVALLAIGRFFSVVPAPVSTLLVRTNAGFVPFVVAWAALGRLLYKTADYER